MSAQRLKVSLVGVGTVPSVSKEMCGQRLNDEGEQQMITTPPPPLPFNLRNPFQHPQGGGDLECKALKHRQTLGGGVGPGAAEIFEKIKLGKEATLSHVIEHLRGREGGISEVLEATLKTPVEVQVVKMVRKMTIKTGQEKDASFEVTGVSLPLSLSFFFFLGPACKFFTHRAEDDPAHPDPVSVFMICCAGSVCVPYRSSPGSRCCKSYGSHPATYSVALGHAVHSGQASIIALNDIYIYISFTHFQASIDEGRSYVPFS